MLTLAFYFAAAKRPLAFSPQKISQEVPWRRFAGNLSWISGIFEG
jgi:hypothetical protein